LFQEKIFVDVNNVDVELCVDTFGSFRITDHK
jgi:hypothetical protein